MSDKETFLDTLTAQLREAGIYNRNDQVAPAAVLWPDEQKQWESLIPLLRDRIALLTLGEYEPATRTGPAYWIRCMTARTLPEDVISEDKVPLIYLPGYGKQDLRAIEECPKPLQPLAELQYRGTLWVHRNGRDWTVAGFLHSVDVPVAADNDTKEALARALTRLAREPLARLRKRAPLDAEFFNELLHPDAVRQMLLWLSDPQAFREQITATKWGAFRALCRQKYGVEPDKDGPITAAQRLTEQSGEWAAVWQRYVVAPEAYPGIPDLLQQAQPEQLFLLEPSPVWPASSERAEADLRKALVQLRGKLPDEVRDILSTLEEEHGPRRQWVWGKLGQVPLAMALQHLHALAKLSKQPLGGTDVVAIAENYTSWGWQVDGATLDALATVDHLADVTAVKNAILPLYEPWLRQAAAKMQKAVLEDPTDYAPGAPPEVIEGTCVVFSDALRYDAAQSLVDSLKERGLICGTAWCLAALPTVTATAKPAVSPVADQVEGSTEPGLTPVARATGTSLSPSSLRSMLENVGWQVLQDNGHDLGDPSGRAWLELGAVDSYGHGHGWKIAHHVRGEVRVLADRVESLLDHGWKRVLIVTDHGWLMLPDGLPKAELPIHLTTIRKGRCAVLKVGANTEQPVVAWHWNSNVHLAIARDIHCFEAGKEYEHGGISPQECIVPVITVKASQEVKTVKAEEVK